MKHINLPAILCALLCLICVVDAEAVPARRTIFKFCQSDGTQIALQRVGDEFGHLTLLADGTVVVMKGNDYYFAFEQSGQYVSSGVKAHQMQKLTASQRSLLVNNPTVKRGAKALSVDNRRAQSSAMPAPLTRAANSFGKAHLGDYRAIVILMQFPDLKFSVANTHSVFDNFLNGDNYSYNGATGSVKEYFEESSNGQFHTQFDLYGPYTAANKMSYYGTNDSMGNDQYLSQLIAEACAAAEPEADFTLYADNGVVRSVYVIFAGCSEAEGAPSQAIWPQQYFLIPGDGCPSDTRTLYDGVRVNSYACCSELQGSNVESGQIVGVGLFCHEFGHILGQYDFYDTDYQANGEAFGLDNTSIMHYGCYLNNERTPPTYNVMERWLMGWIEPKTITEGGQYVLEPIYQNAGYKIDTPTTGEFFLFENRPKAAANKWDSALLNAGSDGDGGDGMLIFHVDQSSRYVDRWAANMINAYSAHECMRLMRADMSATMEKSQRWYWPGQTRSTTFDEKSNPSMTSWKKASTELSIINISQNNLNITFDVVEPFQMESFDFDAHPFDITLRWKSGKSEKWIVDWSDESGKLIGSKKVSGFVANIAGLDPVSTYSIGISVDDGNGTSRFTQQLSTSANSTSARAMINGMKAKYAQGEAIVLSVKNCASNSVNVVWSVDNQPQSETCLTNLSKGEHLIKAQIVSKDGVVEYLMRYITVE